VYRPKTTKQRGKNWGDKNVQKELGRKKRGLSSKIKILKVNGHRQDLKPKLGAKKIQQKRPRPRLRKGEYRKETTGPIALKTEDKSFWSKKRQKKGRVG